MIIFGNTITIQKPSLSLNGGTLSGPLNMNSNALTGIPAPTADDHAVNKAYADIIKRKAEEAATSAVNALRDAKDYSDAKHKEFSAILTAEGWSAAAASYTQTAEIEGMLATDDPHYTVVYSGDVGQKMAQKEAFALIDDLETEDGKAVFTCFEEKPEIDLTIKMEANR